MSGDQDHRIAELEAELKSLKRSEELYRSLVEKQTEGIGIVDLEERFIFANPAAHRIFGVASGTLVGRSLREFTNEDSYRQIQTETDKRRNKVGSVYELQFRRADDEVRMLLVSANPAFDDDRRVRGTFGVFRDITEMKQSEMEKEKLKIQLLHAQKMETAGRLAGGVAHDFNNLLTVIQGSSEMLLHKLMYDDPLLHLVQEIHDASQRAGALTRQLLAFSRRQVLEPRVIDPVRTVSNVHQMLRRLLGENIEIVITANDDVGNVEVDPAQLEQAIVNLAVNARDAMPDGGRMTFSISDVAAIEDDDKPDSLCGDAPWVCITVTDTGVGMDEQVLDRIYEPFFTTKDKSKGTGLGLSMVYGFVKQSGGHIRARSQRGEGTSFQICLPGAQHEDEITSELDGRRSEPPGGATILVVEDEDSVRRLACMVLRSRGYSVLEADSGEEAEDALVNNEGPVHLALMDVVLPGMSGPKVVEKLLAREPGLRVLYMSGYTDDQLGEHGMLDEDVNFIAKPFSNTNLLRKVRAVLEAPH